MPYVRKGKSVYKRSGKKVGTSKSIAMAKRHLRALYAAERVAAEGRKRKRG